MDPGIHFPLTRLRQSQLFLLAVLASCWIFFPYGFRFFGIPPVGVQPEIAVAAESHAAGKELLDDLVRKANQGGELIATMTSAWSKALRGSLS